MPNRKKDSGEGTTAIPVHCPPLMSYVNLSSSLNISVLQSYNLQNREAVLVLFWDDFAPMRGLLELFCPMRHGAMSEILLVSQCSRAERGGGSRDGTYDTHI